jgi:hypothetical protein
MKFLNIINHFFRIVFVEIYWARAAKRPCGLAKAFDLLWGCVGLAALPWPVPAHAPGQRLCASMRACPGVYLGFRV